MYSEMISSIVALVLSYLSINLVLKTQDLIIVD